MAVIRCDECGRIVEFDEVTDAPVPHTCNEYDPDDEGLEPLDFEDYTSSWELEV